MKWPQKRLGCHPVRERKTTVNVTGSVYVTVMTALSDNYSFIVYNIIVVNTIVYNNVSLVLLLLLSSLRLRLRLRLRHRLLILHHGILLFA
jgi:hypothetical protein